MYKLHPIKNQTSRALAAYPKFDIPPAYLDKACRVSLVVGHRMVGTLTHISNRNLSLFKDSHLGGGQV